jgi:ferredoxin--NADP+ reductase
MNIPGEHLSGCHSATAFVGWYNGHPDFCDHVFDLSHENAIIVGQGNVAIDVCRILTKTVDELRHTDIAEHALDALAESRIRQVYLVGRRGPVQAKFTYQELKELTELSACALETPAEELILNPASEAELDKRDSATRGRVRNYETLTKFAIESPSTKPRRCTLRFLLSPIKLMGDQQLQQVMFERNYLTGPVSQQTALGTGEYETIDCGLLLSSIGYQGTPMRGVPFDSAQGIIPNHQGRVLDNDNPVPGLYAVGWVKRGPTGLIGTNKADARETVTALLSDLSKITQSTRAGLAGILPLLKQRSIKVVHFSDWQKIDQIEIERGLVKAKPREKFTRVADMLSVVAAESNNP